MDIRNYQSLELLVAAAIRLWPAHEKFLRKRFESAPEAELRFADEVCAIVIKTYPADIDELIAGYKWTCGAMMLEEAYFRKNGAYRYHSFDEVNRRVYGDAAYMNRYLAGLLLSQVFWKNHFQSIQFYCGQYLPLLPRGGSLAEIGPGHGLLMALAANRGNLKHLSGFDISAASAAHTRAALDKLGIGHAVVNERAFDGSGDAVGDFDGLVISEVLEHLEYPDRMLRAWTEKLRQDVPVYINVPINSPAPDHIYLLRNHADCLAMTDAAGLVPQSMALFPATGLNLAEACRVSATISCCIIAYRK